MNDRTHEDGPDAGASQPEVEHEPTIAFHPEALEEHAAEGPHIAGAFQYALVVDGGPQAGLTYVLGEGETLAGRGSDSDIFLGDVTVSRRHARFALSGHELTVEDLGSTNGTYVNGERVERTTLRPGDEVLIGKFHLIVAEGDA